MISFQQEEIKFNLKNKALIKSWIKAAIAKSGRGEGGINFIFCTDDYLLGINQQYLKHNTYTDIITFDYSAENKISGDIFISIDRVKENAEKFSKSFENELHRVMIHGVLHLMGYADKTKKAKEEMTRQENGCLKTLKKLSGE